MKHLGDITRISGYDAPIVDIITGGSPCQDLSVAGKRAGLSGARSGLFMEQIRIIKEMRDKCERMGATDIRPRYMVWENVPGAFSSNKGEDFRAVLEETARIADKTAAIPRPEGGRWSTSGCIVGNGWSIAWRVHDAQFWGVPQRRRRIALVADFGGQSAPEILYERESVCGNIEQSGTQEQGTAGDVENGIENAIPINTMIATRDKKLGERTGLGIGEAESPAYTISSAHEHAVAYSYLGQGARDGKEREFVYDARGNGDGSIAPTITVDHENRITDYTAITFSNEAYDEWKQNETGATLRQSGGIYQGGSENIVAVYCRNFSENDRINGTLQAKSNGGISLNLQNVCRVNSTVRRLTPLECERLQGFPDHWTDIGDWTDSKGKKHKDADSPRYKALGNSIALPFWQWLADRICAQYDRETTVASLFDGIGGFPLVFTRTGKCKPIWASEIEEFPIAVTKLRFGKETEITQKAL